MKNKKAIIVSAIVALIAAAGVTYLVKQQRGGENEQLLTASMNVPLTGPIALPTKSFQEAALFALSDIGNQAEPPAFKMDWNDNAAKPSSAVTIAQQRSANADLFYIGYGAELDATMPVIEDLGKPVFAFSFQASASKHPLVFRNIVSYKNEAPVFVEYVKTRNAKKVAAIFHDLPDTNEQFRQLVVPELLKHGLSESDISLFAHPLGGADFRNISAKVKAASPDLVMISGFQSNLVPLIEALRTEGLVGKGNVIGTFAVLDLAQIVSKEALEGIAVATPSFMLRPSAKAMDFQKRFREKFKREASFNEFCGYDFVVIMNDLADRLPVNPSPEQTVKSLKETDIEGVSGRITFDEQGDVLYQTEVGIFQQGKLVPLDH